MRRISALHATRLGWLVAGLLPISPLAAETPVIDRIFVNGTVLTPDGTAEAVATSGGAIVAVGKREALLALPHDPGAVVDLGGNTLMPGLYDMHVHTYFAGQAKLACQFPQGAKPDMIMRTVKACVAKAKPGEWITGGSWVAAVFKPGQQHRRLLDKIAPDNPVALTDESLHSVWANSKALELAGITRDTPNPEGGVIDRDTKGEPTGVLRETAARGLLDRVPKPDVKAQVAAIKAATDEMLSYGIVAFADASIRQDYALGLAEYAKSGGLKQYSRGCIVWGPNTIGGEQLIPDRQRFEHGRLRYDCVKLFLDGVPLEGRTAAMVEPYAASSHGAHAHGHGPHGAPEHGMLLIPQDKLNEAVASFDRQGLQVKFHAAGDASVRAAADAIAHARALNGFTGPRHDIGHNTFIHEDDVARGRALGFAWEMSPYIWYPTPITAIDMMTAIGPERMKRLWPIRDVIESGALVVVGSDWPVVPSVNPWLAFETMVTRQMPGATGTPIGEGQRVTREQALTLLTRNGAALMGRLDRGGTIEVGKMADMIIVDRNPLTAPVGTIHQTRVLRTYIAGEEVYVAR